MEKNNNEYDYLNYSNLSEIKNIIYKMKYN